MCTCPGDGVELRPPALPLVVFVPRRRPRHSRNRGESEGAGDAGRGTHRHRPHVGARPPLRGVPPPGPAARPRGRADRAAARRGPGPPGPGRASRRTRAPAPVPPPRGCRRGPTAPAPTGASASSCWPATPGAYADLCEVVTRRHLEADRFRFDEVFAREWPDFVLLTPSPGLLGALAATPNRDRLYGELIANSAATRRRSRELEAVAGALRPAPGRPERLLLPRPRAVAHAPAPHGDRPQLHPVAPAAGGVRLAPGLPAQRRVDGVGLSVAPPGPGQRRAPGRGVRLHRAAPGRVDPAARRRAPGRDAGQPPGAAGLGGARAQLRRPPHLRPGPPHPAHGAGDDREARLPVVLPDRQGDPRLGQRPLLLRLPPAGGLHDPAGQRRQQHHLLQHRRLRPRSDPPRPLLPAFPQRGPGLAARRRSRLRLGRARRGAEVHHPALGRGARGGHLHHQPLPRARRLPRDGQGPRLHRRRGSPASCAATSRGRRASTTTGSAACGRWPPPSGASRGSWGSIPAAC